MKLRESESQIQMAIMNYLEVRGYYVQRLNAGSYKTQTGYVKGVKTGTPDIFAFRNSCKESQTGCGDVNLLFVEVKVPGNKPTVLQLMRMRELEEHGAQCVVASSVEDLHELGI